MEREESARGHAKSRRVILTDGYTLPEEVNVLMDVHDERMQALSSYLHERGVEIAESFLATGVKPVPFEIDMEEAMIKTSFIDSWIIPITSGHIQMVAILKGECSELYTYISNISDTDIAHLYGEQADKESMLFSIDAVTSILSDTHKHLIEYATSQGWLKEKE